MLGIRVARTIARSAELHLVVSPIARTILRDESGIDLGGGDEGDHERRVRELLGSDSVRAWHPRNLEAPIASGSFRTEGMVVAPCSMKTLAGIAHGYAGDLIGRAADVTLKERRRLVVAPREMPLSSIHLRNMLALSESGAIVAPPIPALYCRPLTIDDLLDFMAGRLLDALGVEHDLYRGWEGKVPHEEGTVDV